MTTIVNQASATYLSNGQSQTIVSNVATTELIGPVGSTTLSIESNNDGYLPNQVLSYIIAVNNTGAVTYTNFDIIFNMGTYTLGGLTLTPLDYIGPSFYYLGGIYQDQITPTVNANNIVYNFATFAPGDAIIIALRVKTNDYAQLEVGSSIDIVVDVEANNLALTEAATHTTPVANYTDIDIYKHMCPNPVIEGAPLSYFFNISNKGNTSATDIVLTDTFDPAPNTISSVTLDGVSVASTDYSYSGGTLTIPAVASSFSITVDAAAISQSAVNGIVNVTAANTEIVVVGSLS